MSRKLIDLRKITPYSELISTINAQGTCSFVPLIRLQTTINFQEIFHNVLGSDG